MTNEMKREKLAELNKLKEELMELAKEDPLSIIPFESGVAKYEFWKTIAEIVIIDYIEHESALQKMADKWGIEKAIEIAFRVISHKLVDLTEMSVSPIKTLEFTDEYIAMLMENDKIEATPV